MWPSRIQNPKFLQSLYDGLPDVGAVELTSVDLTRDGPALVLSFLSRTLPANPPKKWGGFNRVSFSLYCFDLSAIEITEFGRLGWSFLRMRDEGPQICLTVDGACRIEATFDHLFIRSIKGVIVDAGPPIELVR